MHLSYLPRAHSQPICPPSFFPPSSFSLLHFSYSLCALHLILCFLSNISFLTAHRAPTATPLPPCLLPYLPTSLPPSLLHTSYPFPPLSSPSVYQPSCNVCLLFISLCKFCKFCQFSATKQRNTKHLPPPPSCPLLRPPTAPPFCSPSPLPC